MIKKEVLIISHGLDIGGVEKSLLALFEQFDYKRVNVDVFLFRHDGDLMKYLPEQINLLPKIEEYSHLEISAKKTLKDGYLLIFLGKLLAKIKSKLKDSKKTKESYRQLDYSFKYTKYFMPKITDKKYDVVISYLAPHYYALSKVSAKKRIAWIHTDYSKIDIDVNSERKIWEKFDNIIAISREVEHGFLNRFPSLKEKMVIIPNFINDKLILNMANEEVKDITFCSERVNILSIGRFTYAKNFEMIPRLCKDILNLGLNIDWYLIGFGSYYSKIINEIKKYQVQDHVHILGKKINPYPYLKHCDIYAQLSRYEGRSVAVIEAQILSKPVVISNYQTAKSQLKNGVNGHIISMEYKKMVKELFEFINNKDYQAKLVLNCKKTDFTEHSYQKKLNDILKLK